MFGIRVIDVDGEQRGSRRGGSDAVTRALVSSALFALGMGCEASPPSSPRPVVPACVKPPAGDAARALLAQEIAPGPDGCRLWLERRAPSVAEARDSFELRGGRPELTLPVVLPTACTGTRCRLWIGRHRDRVWALASRVEGDVTHQVWLGTSQSGRVAFARLWRDEHVLEDFSDVGPRVALRPEWCGDRWMLVPRPRLRVDPHRFEEPVGPAFVIASDDTPDATADGSELRLVAAPEQPRAAECSPVPLPWP